MLFLLALLSSTQNNLARAQDDPPYSLFSYPFFLSRSPIPPQQDGPSEQGVMCRPGMSFAVQQTDLLYVSDMCGSGSTIRKVTWDGIKTIAGSSSMTGYEDGSGAEARFGGLSQGNQLVNGLSLADNMLFLADTVNNVIRSVDPTTGTTGTFISPESKLDGLSLSFPSTVAQYDRTGSNTDLFISDTGNNRLLFTPIEFVVTPPLTLALKSFQPGSLSISKNQKKLYFISRMDTINGLHLEENSNWTIGNSSCTGYISALHLSADESKVMYFGRQNSVTGIYSLPAAYSDDVDSLCGTLEYAWPYEDTVRSMFSRSPVSYYAVTNYAVYIISNRDLIFTDPSVLDDRSLVQIGFPVAPLPIVKVEGGQPSEEQACLMSAFYEKMMDDIASAFDTTNYYIQFPPISDRSLLVSGTQDVQDWCEMLEDYQRSEDGTVLIMNIYGPNGKSYSNNLNALRSSKWKASKKYLEDLYYDDLIPGGNTLPLFPFCLLSCEGSSCFSYSVSGIHYCGRFGCDRFCVAGIICASTMGLTLIALIILAIISPVNVFYAVFMFPIM